MELMLTLSLSSGDELWHMTLYQWLIDSALTERLLEVNAPQPTEYCLLCSLVCMFFFCFVHLMSFFADPVTVPGGVS